SETIKRKKQHLMACTKMMALAMIVALLGISFWGSPLTAVKGDDPCKGIEPPELEACPVYCIIHDPVCGDDGYTYDCGCRDAMCSEVRVVHKGSCDGQGKKHSMACTKLMVLAVIVALLGISFWGSPLTAVKGDDPCKGIEPPELEACPVYCIIHDPVCGDDGYTYDCGCRDAMCSEVRVVHKGSCDGQV
ncbi:hypothetical protein LINGRAHAP2_LOCUS16033, partial [Linum grandiflorum]